jgi:ATP-dependent Clp protease ATP-binding subunit ClpC
MFDRYTDRARKAMGLARQEAQRLNHEYIGTEHVLLGITQVTGVAPEVLLHFDITQKRVRDEVAKLVQRGNSSAVTMGQLPFTPRIKKAMQLALEEGSRLGHNYVGTEHLLLGIMLEGDNVATQVLLNAGLDLDKVRAEVLELLGSGPKSEPWRGASVKPVYEEDPGGRECYRCSYPAQVNSQYCPDHVPSEAEAILRDGLNLIAKGGSILDGESAAHLARKTLGRASKLSSRKPAKEERDAR